MLGEERGQEAVVDGIGGKGHGGGHHHLLLQEQHHDHDQAEGEGHGRLGGLAVADVGDLQQQEGQGSGPHQGGHRAARDGEPALAIEHPGMGDDGEHGHPTGIDGDGQAEKTLLAAEGIHHPEPGQAHGPRHGGKADEDHAPDAVVLHHHVPGQHGRRDAIGRDVDEGIELSPKLGLAAAPAGHVAIQAIQGQGQHDQLRAGRVFTLARLDDAHQCGGHGSQREQVRNNFAPHGHSRAPFLILAMAVIPAKTRSPLRTSTSTSSAGR